MSDVKPQILRYCYLSLSIKDQEYPEDKNINVDTCKNIIFTCTQDRSPNWLLNRIPERLPDRSPNLNTFDTHNTSINLSTPHM